MNYSYLWFSTTKYVLIEPQPGPLEEEKVLSITKQFLQLLIGTEDTGIVSFCRVRSLVEREETDSMALH